MRALVYSRPLTMEVVDVDEPKVADGEVLVSVRAVGICGSELEGVASQSAMRVPPLIMGHEFVGVREDTGKAVIVNPMLSCGACDICDSGYPNICRNRQIIGIHRSGGYAERVAVPASSCFEVGHPTMPFTHLAACEPVANAVHALRLVEEHMNWPQRIAIIGAGAVGFSLALVAQQRGIPNVDLCDRVEERLEWAGVAGASGVAELGRDYDVVFDTVGSSSTRGLSLERLRPGGTSVWVGLHEASAGIDGQAMIRQEHRVLTTFCYTRRDFQVAVDLMPRLPGGWVEPRALEEGAELFQSLMQSPGSAIKYALVP